MCYAISFSTTLFWVIMQCVVVISCQRFGTTYRCPSRVKNYCRHFGTTYRCPSRVKNYCRHFGTTYRSHLQGSRILADVSVQTIRPVFKGQQWPLKVGPFGCTEMLVINGLYILRDNPEERDSYQLPRGSLKSRMHVAPVAVKTVTCLFTSIILRN